MRSYRRARRHIMPASRRRWPRRHKMMPQRARGPPSSPTRRLFGLRALASRPYARGRHIRRRMRRAREYFAATSCAKRLLPPRRCHALAVLHIRKALQKRESRRTPRWQKQDDADGQYACRCRRHAKRVDRIRRTPMSFCCGKMLPHAIRRLAGRAPTPRRRIMLTHLRAISPYCHYSCR